MANFEFWLGMEDVDRLFALKQELGKDSLTGNEFAKELLEREIHRLYPQSVEFDEDGEIIPRRITPCKKAR